MTRELTPALLTLVLLGACVAPPGGESEQRDDPASASSPSAGPEPTRGPEFVAAPASGDVVELVNRERTRARAEQRELIVYVGASWCEPCQYFHDAVEHGSLDQTFPDLRLLEFDLDRDRERLSAANYSSQMIPLFVVPGPDGRGGPRRMSGSIKGPGAVDNLRPRLEALLAAARADHN